MTESLRVDVLIVTLCLPARAPSIRRTVAAVLGQTGVDVQLVIVVNGDRFDRVLLEELIATPRVVVLRQEAPSIFLARRLARERVSAPFFAFIDDDDLYLPDALAIRTEAMMRDPAIDALITNGHLAVGDGDSPMLSDIAAIRRDPLAAMLRSNWLATASAQFRTETVTPDYFDPTLRSNDMTYLGFRLALERNVAFIDTPTYRKIYSADSISHTEAWVIPSLDTLDRLRHLPMPDAIRRQLDRKRARAAHEIAEIYRRRGELGIAWRYHLRSLGSAAGFADYALYSRRLLRAAARNAIPPS